MTVTAPTPSVNHSKPAALAPDAASALRALHNIPIHLSGDAGYDAGRAGWNVTVDQRPAAVACPTNASQVAAVVGAAASAGLRIAPQGTGHAAGPLGTSAAPFCSAPQP